MFWSCRHFFCVNAKTVLYKQQFKNDKVSSLTTEYTKYSEYSPKISLFGNSREIVKLDDVKVEDGKNRVRWRLADVATIDGKTEWKEEEFRFWAIIGRYFSIYIKNVFPIIIVLLSADGRE